MPEDLNKALPEQNDFGKSVNFNTKPTQPRPTPPPAPPKPSNQNQNTTKEGK